MKNGIQELQFHWDWGLQDGHPHSTYIKMCKYIYIYTHKCVNTYKCKWTNKMLLFWCKASVSYGMFINDGMESRTVVKHVNPIHYVTLHVYQKVAWICTHGLIMIPSTIHLFLYVIFHPTIHTFLLDRVNFTAAASSKDKYLWCIYIYIYWINQGL